jgi:hypothetical protein
VCTYGGPLFNVIMPLPCTYFSIKHTQVELCLGFGRVVTVGGALHVSFEYTPPEIRRPIEVRVRGLTPPIRLSFQASPSALSLQLVCRRLMAEAKAAQAPRPSAYWPRE